MKIISTNTGKPKTIVWHGKQILTGLYKKPSDGPIFLGAEGVTEDHVIDRQHHGGKDKACYLYSADHYEYWKGYYPDLDWQWGMFGENLTISDLDEYTLYVGDIFKVGDAIVQVTQPRQPCFKLGVRFGTQEVVKQFSLSDYPGAYVRILKEGLVKNEDEFILRDSFLESQSIKTIFNMLFRQTFTQIQVLEAIKNPNLAESCRNDLIKKWKLE